MYAVFTCRRTYELFQEYRYSHGVRIPIKLERQLNRRTNKVQKVTRAAMPGFVFVPSMRVNSFRWCVPEWFNTRQLTTANGTPHLVAPDALVRVQKQLEYENMDFRAPAPKTSTFNVGDKVDILFGLVQLQGEIVKFKSNGDARIRLSGTGGYLVSPQHMLVKIA